jgi:hypothetical protein
MSTLDKRPDGRPDGIMFDVPESERWSDEEKEQYLRSLHRGGPPPQRTSARPAPSPAAPDGIYSAADLLSEEGYRSEPYRMPNGKQVWVHPVSPEEAMWMNRSAVSEVRASGRLREGLTQQEIHELNEEARTRAQVYQVVCCCRTGPEMDAPPIFQPQHADPLRKRPGMLDAIQDICRISDSLSAGTSAAALLEEALAGFFGAMTSWLGMWCSQLSTDSLTDCKEILSDFASSVSSINQPGVQWDSALGMLCMCMISPDDAKREPFVKEPNAA